MAVESLLHVKFRACWTCQTGAVSALEICRIELSLEVKGHENNRMSNLMLLGIRDVLGGGVGRDAKCSALGVLS